MTASKSVLGVVVCLAVFGLSSDGGARQVGRTKGLTIEQIIKIKHPSEPMWSPDGRQVAFVWDQGGVSNFYVASANGQGSPLALTSFADGQVGGAFWSRDGQTLYFPHEGGLWQVSISGAAQPGQPGGGQAKPAWTASERESDIVPSPDGMRVAFVRPRAQRGNEGGHGADLFVRSLSDGAESRAAGDDVSIRGVVWSADGGSLAYNAGSKIIHHDESPAYSGAKLIYRVSEYVPGQEYAVRIASGAPVAIGTPGEYGGIAWADAGHIVFDRVSDEFKKYTIYL